MTLEGYLFYNPHCNLKFGVVHYNFILARSHTLSGWDSSHDLESGVYSIFHEVVLVVPTMIHPLGSHYGGHWVYW